MVFSAELDNSYSLCGAPFVYAKHIEVQADLIRSMLEKEPY